MKSKSKLMTIYQHKDGRIEILMNPAASVSPKGTKAIFVSRKKEKEEK